VAKRKQDAEVVEEQKKQEENKPPTQEDGEEGRICSFVSFIVCPKLVDRFGNKQS
jgi:hypothetical protein